MPDRIIRVARMLIPSLCMLLGAAAAADACSCGGPGPACVAATRAAAVFVGRVASVDRARVEFEVEQPVVGVNPGQITIGNGPGNCGLGFRAGERYVVYAHRNPSSGELFTGMCTRTRPLSDPHTRADLAHFDRLQKGVRTDNVLNGVVIDATADLADRTGSWRGIPRVVVTASPESGTPRRTTTREDGTYQFTGLTSGRFRITAATPVGYEAHEPFVVAMTETNQCVERDIPLRIDGRVRGQLLDEGGRPLRSVALHLADAGAAKNEASVLPTLTTTTNEAGAFEFRHVGPGRYVVGVGLQEGVRAGKISRRRFYGGTGDAASATIVDVGKAARVALAPFRLTPLPVERTITASVRAPTDDVAAATELFLIGATREPLEHGGMLVTLRLPFGASYFIQALPPEGYRITQGDGRIERDDADRAIDFVVERR
jgi:hypothetical protein